MQGVQGEHQRWWLQTGQEYPLKVYNSYKYKTMKQMAAKLFFQKKWWDLFVAIIHHYKYSKELKLVAATFFPPKIGGNICSGHVTATKYFETLGTTFP